MNLLAAFLLGFAGSLHCAAMCGPLVLAVNAARRRNPATSGVRLFNAEILDCLAYHGGRLLTYCVLGGVSGLIGTVLVFAGFQRWVSVAAGCFVLIASITSLGPQWTGAMGRLVSAGKTKFGHLLRKRTVASALLLGGLNGLLPCGLVYIACAVAATSGGVSSGIATMLAFGLGTAPMLLSIGLAGKAIRWSNPPRLKRVVLICATVAGVLLIVRGLALGIPYVSPQLSNSHEALCGRHHT